MKLELNHPLKTLTVCFTTVLLLSGCSMLPWSESTSSFTFETPLKKPKPKHIHLGYSQQFMHEQLGVPQILRSAQTWFEQPLQYERYQYQQSEIQVLYANNDVVAYTLRNYQPRKPELKRSFRFSMTEDKWVFGKSTFQDRLNRSRIDDDFKTAEYRCRIEQTDLNATKPQRNEHKPMQGSDLQVWFSSYHANWQPTARPTAVMMLDTSRICPSSGKAERACLQQLNRYICVLGKDGIG